jgi:hypothetical protein
VGVEVTARLVSALAGAVAILVVALPVGLFVVALVLPQPVPYEVKP